jgi:hypothetical protein
VGITSIDRDYVHNVSKRKASVGNGCQFIVKELSSTKLCPNPGRSEDIK